MTDPSGYPITPFADAGLWVSVPAGVTVSLTRVSDAPPSTSEFQVVRMVGNLKFTNARGETRFEFSPPARLQVRFNSADADMARRRNRRLVLAWWNGAQQRWMPFTEGTTVLAAGAPPDGGDHYYDIPALDDPPIGWGT